MHLFFQGFPLLINDATDYGHTMAESLIICCPNQIPISKKYLVCGYKGLVFCRGWSMENMDKWLTVPKRPKISQMPQNVSAQILCPNPNVWDFDEKRLHWASVVRGFFHFSISKKKAKSHSQTYFKRPKYKPIYSSSIMKLFYIPLSLWTRGPSLYYVSKMTGWVGSENRHFCWLSVLYLCWNNGWMGQKKSKIMPT